jgi:hypothetical protein
LVSSVLKLQFLAGVFGLGGSLISGLVCTRLVMSTLQVSGPWRALSCCGIGILLCGLSGFFSFYGCVVVSYGK